LSDALPNSFGEPLGFLSVHIGNNVSVVIERDLRITVSHKLRDDVDGRSGLKQASRYSVAEAMNPHVRSLRSCNTEPAHRAMNTVPDDVIGHL
jgi:hypothetical protein